MELRDALVARAEQALNDYQKLLSKPETDEEAVQLLLIDLASLFDERGWNWQKRTSVAWDIGLSGRGA